MDPLTARKTWRTLEPVHGAIYFVPEAREEYAAIGIDDRMRGYFASRAAPKSTTRCVPTLTGISRCTEVWNPGARTSVS